MLAHASLPPSRAPPPRGQQRSAAQQTVPLLRRTWHPRPSAQGVIVCSRESNLPALLRELNAAATGLVRAQTTKSLRTGMGARRG